jgi:transcriptional regulator with XRE-family HTH domain
MEKRQVPTAERLREAMTEAGKKQIDLVKETGLQRSAISRYLSGEYEPKQNAINKLAIALNVSEMWLWGFDVPKERTPAQKENDLLAKLVVKMRRDPDFRATVAQLAELDPDQYVNVSGIIAALRR